MLKDIPVLFEKKEQCSGCTACYAICPQGAISMAEDDEGFLYSKIDADKCIRCYKCVNVCPFKSNSYDTMSVPSIETEVYAARLKNKKELAKSSSGGGVYSII